LAQWLLEREAEFEALAQHHGRIGAWPTALVLDTVGALAAMPLPQKEILAKLLVLLESSVYVLGEQRLVEDERIIAEATLPRRYASRLPCFVVARQQQARVQELINRIAYLKNISVRCKKLKMFSSVLQLKRFAAGGEGGNRIAAATSLARDSMRTFLYVFVLGFWKVYYRQQQRVNRTKTTMIHDGMVQDLVKPFKHWQMAWMDGLVGDQESTHEAFTLEQKMLAVEVKDLQTQQEDLRGELSMSLGTEKRMQAKLDVLTGKREALAAKLAQAQPDLLQSTLGKVLNISFVAALREAQLCRLPVHQGFASKDFAALLSLEEEDVMRLARMSSEQLIIRWLNYHIGQFKVLANTILDAIARQANSDDNRHADPDGGGALIGEMPARDAEAYADRCRLVRSLHKLRNLTEDLKDSSALAVLYAAIVCPIGSDHGMGGGGSGGGAHGGGGGGGHGSTSAAGALWMLDSRDHDARAANITNAFRLIAPSAAAQFFLRPSDITKCNVDVLHPILSALFLHASRLPSAMSNSQVFDYVGAQPQEEDAEQLESPWQQVAATLEASASLCAYETAQDLSQLLENGEVPNDLLRLPGSELILRWLNVKLELTGADKITNLSDLKGGEVLMELFLKVAPDVLSVIPEAKMISDLTGSVRVKMLYGVLIQCASRCAAFDVLTREALIEGQGDVIATFLAGLFLCRPSLLARQDSALKQHVDTINACAEAGAKAQADGSGFIGLCAVMKDSRANFQEALLAVQATRSLHQKVNKELFYFQADLLTQRCNGTPCKVLGTQDEMQKAESQRGDRVVAFNRLLDIVVAESHNLDEDGEAAGTIGQQVEDVLRKSMGFLKEAYKHYSTAAFRPADIGGRAGKGGRSGTMAARRSTTVGLLRGGKECDMKALSLDLRGLTRLHKDCKFRKLRLAPADIEAIYMEVRVEQMAGHDSDGADGLTLESFALSLVIMAARAKLAMAKRRQPPDIAEKFSHLIEKHLWPCAMPRNNDLFYTMAYDPGMGKCLKKYECMLRAVFQSYSSMGIASIAALRSRQRRRGGADDGHKGSAATTAQHATLDVNGTEALLEHAGLLVGQLDSNVLRGIFRGIQQGPAAHAKEENESSDEAESSDDDDDDDDDNSDDCSFGGSDAQEDGSESGRHASSESFVRDGHQDLQISYQEFIDVLVAVLMYRDPNPFRPFIQRFENFLVHGLLVPLKKHWMDKQDNEPGTGLARTLDFGLEEVMKTLKPVRHKFSPTQGGLAAIRETKKPP